MTITSAISQMLDGTMGEEDMESFLIALSERGETAQDITEAARVMREKSLKINAPQDAVDCCGTGGDGAHTWNISTAVAIVAASCGVPVAKHGGGASTSKSGSVDVLAALGINIDAPPEKLEEALHRFNFAFMAAPRHHAAMKNVREIRKKLGRRTIFNLLGPLTNPAGTKKQLIGVYDRKWLLPMAEALRDLGTQTAWIVHGADGLDEITITGTTYAAILKDGTITETRLYPESFGLPAGNPDELKGGDAQENAVALMRLLNGEKSAYRDIVLVNASAVLNIHGSVASLKEGTKIAAEALDSGKALQLLNDYKAFL